MNKFDADITRINLQEIDDIENKTQSISILELMQESDIEIDGEIVDAYYITSSDTLMLFIEKNDYVTMLTTWAGHGG